MNKIVAISAAAAVPVAPSIANEASLASPQVDISADEILVKAIDRVIEVDKFLDGLHLKYGDDADSREDYLAAAADRLRKIETLIAVPAVSPRPMRRR